LLVGRGCTITTGFSRTPVQVLWLFHHVLKTALYQLKAFELVPADTSRGLPSEELRSSVSAALASACAFGVWALAFSPDDTVKCIGLVCAFFAPVWLLIWKARPPAACVCLHAGRASRRSS
jgi:hypothetical protein